MSILTDLRAALAAKEEAARLFDSLSPFTTVAEDWNDAEADLTATEDDLNCLLTGDTIRALIDVAEAAQEQNERYCSGITDENIDEEVRIALAPLVKEADHA